jgi:hypothetical protein
MMLSVALRTCGTFVLVLDKMVEACIEEEIKTRSVHLIKGVRLCMYVYASLVAAKARIS